MSLLKFAAAAALSLALLLPAHAQKTTRINALIMSSNAPAETMSQNVPVYRRVLAQLSESLSQRGIQVYDAERLGSQFLAPGKARYEDDELMEIARAVAKTTPIDVVVFFEVVADIQQVVPPRATTGSSINIAYPRVRMPGRILNVRTAQHVASFEVEPGRLPPLPTPCDSTCVYREVGNEARLLASELGDALVVKLEGWNAGGLNRNSAGNAGEKGPSAGAPMAGGTAALPACDGFSGDYVVMLRDFRTQELLKFEELLRGYGCFEEMRPTRSGGTFTEYFYKTSAGAQRLNTNLRRSLDYLDLPGQVRFDGSRFEVVRITTRQ